MVMHMVMDMATATTARGRLRFPLMPSPDTDMAMDTTAIMARGRPRLPLMLSPAMDMVMDTAMDMVTVTDTAMEATDMDTMATTARGLLMLLPVMDTMVMDMAMDTMDMVTDMAMATT